MTDVTIFCFVWKSSGPILPAEREREKEREREREREGEKEGRREREREMEEVTGRER